MIEEDKDNGDGLPFARTYDSFKHTTSVALLSLAGVFAFADGGGMQFKRGQLIVILTFIAIAGVTSMMMAGSLATLEIKPEPREDVVRRIRRAQLVVGGSLFAGLGGFTYNFISAMFK